MGIFEIVVGLANMPTLICGIIVLINSEKIANHLVEDVWNVEEELSPVREPVDVLPAYSTKIHRRNEGSYTIDSVLLMLMALGVFMVGLFLFMLIELNPINEVDPFV